MTEKEKIEILNKLSKEDLIKIIVDVTGGIPVSYPYYFPPAYPNYDWGDTEKWKHIVYCNNNNTNLT